MKWLWLWISIMLGVLWGITSAPDNPNAEERWFAVYRVALLYGSMGCCMIFGRDLQPPPGKETK